MICSSINDRNFVDDSVKAIIEKIPNIVRTSYAIFEKYGKLINQKYDQLMQSDEKRRIKNVVNVKCIEGLTFDKLLFAFDRDLYIDFMNEINMINNDYSYISSGDYAYQNKSINTDMYNTRLISINLNYLVHPSTSLKRIGDWKYEIKKSVPLIKVQPRFILRKFSDDFSSYMNFSEPYSNEETRNFGVGVSCEHCDSYIDISSLFEIFRSNFYTYSCKYNKNHYSDTRDNQYKYLDICGLEKLDDKTLSIISNEIIDIVTKKVTYSLSVAYLAMLGKLEHDKQNGLISIFTDILDSCRKTVLGSYDSNGDELRTGMSLRHMTVDISTLFNAISKESKMFTSSANKEFNILRNMIQYAFEIKYATFNYIKIPGNNLKHKKLINIVQLAKPQLCFLNGDTRADLQCCVAKIEKCELDCCFCDALDIKVDGTYAYTKRLYDTTKDFIDVYAKLIIIKKRMHDVGGFNVSDGTVDTIGKRSIDYKSYLKATYDELKVSLNNIYNRIRGVIIGKRYLTNNIMVKDSNDDAIKNLNTIVYGVNSESALDEDFYSVDMFGELYQYNRVDYNKIDDKSYYGSINKRISDIRNIYNVLKERECTYSGNSQNLLTAVNTYGNGSLIAFWIAVTECVGDFFDTPYKHIICSFEDIGIGLGYGESSINEMSQKGEIIEDETDVISWDTSLEDKYISLEELNEQVQNLKDKLDENDSESVFGGLLFGDFGGIPLAQEMTAKETEIYNDQLTVRKIPTEEVEAFESLKCDFDTLMAKYF